MIRILLCCLIPVALAAAEVPVAAVDGPLVIQVFGGSEADQAGIRTGDIIIRYKGERVRTAKELAAEIAKVTGARNECVIVLNRDGEERSMLVKAGRLGVQLADMTAGAPMPVVPAATTTRYDFSALADGPQERWCRFLIENKHIGYLHDKLAIDENGMLVYNCDVAFDGGETFGLNHFRVRVSCSLKDGVPTLRGLSFRVPHSSLVYRCKRDRLTDRSEGFLWSIEVGKDEDRGELADAPGELVLPTYLHNRLVPFLVGPDGTTIHIRQMLDGEPRIGELVADRLDAREVLTVDGEEVECRVYQTHHFGRQGNRHWVTADGRLVRSDFVGGSQAILVADKATATAGLPPELLKNKAVFK